MNKMSRHLAVSVIRYSVLEAGTALLFANGTTSKVAYHVHPDLGRLAIGAQSGGCTVTLPTIGTAGPACSG